MNKVKDILAKKPRVVFTVSSDATLYQALEIMADKNIGAILVTDKNGKLAGIFSERDFARKIIIKGRDGDKTTVGEIMTTQVLFVDPETTIDDCMTLMTEKKIRHLPVLDNGELVGIISIGDVVKAYCANQDSIIAEQEFQLGQLERYINQSP